MENRDEKIEVAESAALEWLSLVDSGEYGESWKTGAGLLKRAVTEDQFSHSLDVARGAFGGLISRDIVTRSYETSLPGAPDGEYVVIQYKTSFEKKKEAVETVTPMLETDGTWRVSGYYIK